MSFELNQLNCKPKRRAAADRTRQGRECVRERNGGNQNKLSLFIASNHLQILYLSQNISRDKCYWQFIRGLYGALHNIQIDVCSYNNIANIPQTSRRVCLTKHATEINFYECHTENFFSFRAAEDHTRACKNICKEGIKSNVLLLETFLHKPRPISRSSFAELLKRTSQYNKDDKIFSMTTLDHNNNLTPIRASIQTNLRDVRSNGRFVNGVSTMSL